mgnify:CR=1 FL=1
MQFLQINLAKMQGTRVVRVGGEPFIAVPMRNLFAHSRDAIYANFIMNETTAYGHTFVVSERRQRDGERMPIIGNVSPFVPMTKEEAEVVPDEELQKGFQVDPQTGEILTPQSAAETSGSTSDVFEEAARKMREEGVDYVQSHDPNV